MNNGKNVEQSDPATAKLKSLANLLREGKVSVNANLITVIDADGKVVNVEDLPLAFLAMAYDGQTASIRELTRTLGLRLTAQTQYHELAASAAAGGYEQLLEQYVRTIKLDPVLMTKRLVTDMEVISEITGIGVPPQLDEMVFEAIASLKDDFTAILPSVRAYKAGRGAVPSAAVAQKLYLAVITSSSKVASLSRVRGLQLILNIPPTLGEGAEAQTLEEYVRESIKATGQELPNKGPLHEQLELASNPEEFRRKISEQFALLSGSDGYDNPGNVAGVMNYLRVAANKGIALPEDVSRKLSRYFVMVLAHKGANSTTYDKVSGILEELVRRNAYTVDKDASRAALIEGMNLLADENLNAKGRSRGSTKDSIMRRRRYLNALGGRLGV